MKFSGQAFLADCLFEVITLYRLDWLDISGQNHCSKNLSKGPWIHLFPILKKLAFVTLLIMAANNELKLDGLYFTLSAVSLLERLEVFNAETEEVRLENFLAICASEYFHR